MKLFVNVDEVDGGARTLHLHQPLPRPHSVEHGASVCGALTAVDCASSKLVVVVLASRGRSSGSGSGRVGAGLGRSAAWWWQLNSRHRGRSVLAPAPLLPLPESNKIAFLLCNKSLKGKGSLLILGNDIVRKGYSKCPPGKYCEVPKAE